MSEIKQATEEGPGHLIGEEASDLRALILEGIASTFTPSHGPCKRCNKTVKCLMPTCECVWTKDSELCRCKHETCSKCNKTIECPRPYCKCTWVEESRMCQCGPYYVLVEPPAKETKETHPDDSKIPVDSEPDLTGESNRSEIQINARSSSDVQINTRSSSSIQINTGSSSAEEPIVTRKSTRSRRPLYRLKP